MSASGVGIYPVTGVAEGKVVTCYISMVEGNYMFSLCVQGGNVDEDAEMYLFAISDGQRYEQPFTVDGWVNWQKPAIESIPCGSGTMTVGVCVKAAGGAWGSDNTLTRISRSVKCNEILKFQSELESYGFRRLEGLFFMQSIQIGNVFVVHGAFLVRTGIDHWEDSSWNGASQRERSVVL